METCKLSVGMTGLSQNNVWNLKQSFGGRKTYKRNVPFIGPVCQLLRLGNCEDEVYHVCKDI